MPDAAGAQDPAPMDDFDRELRELTEGRAGDPLFLEPSAAERAGKGGVRVKEAPAVSDGPRAAAPGRAGHRRRRGSRARLFGCLFAVVILLAAGVVAWLRIADRAPGAGARSGSSAGAAPSRQGSFSPASLLGEPPANPFLGTPADAWADGAAGIVAPAAEPAGPFTAAQVAAAYATTRKLLIAADLDRQTLLGGPPAALARLLTPAQRTAFMAGLGKTGVNSDGSAQNTRTWVASFAPGSTALVGTVIKVHGTMRARAVTESGKPVLVIDVSYLFVYAVEPPHNPVDWMRVAVRQYGNVDFRPQGKAGGALEPWDRMAAKAPGPACGGGDGYIYPDYPGVRTVGAGPSGAMASQYLALPGAWDTAVCGPSAATGSPPVTPW